MLDLLISIIIWLVKTLLVPVLPVSIPFFTIETFTGLLETAKPTIIYSLSGFGSIINMGLLFNLVGVIIYAEMILIIFKSAVFLINIGRGSGA